MRQGAVLGYVKFCILIELPAGRCGRLVDLFEENGEQDFLETSHSLSKAE